MSDLTKSQYRFEDCVSHAKPMALLDDDIFFTPGRLRASVTIGPESIFAEAEGVPTWVGMEYMAQTAAAYAGALARHKGSPVKVGFLVGSRRYTVERSHFACGKTFTIDIAEEIYNPDGLSVFACTIADQGETIASANLSVFQPKDLEPYLQGSGNG
ncbi:MAG: 3-hydroxylacyl-ACP dehydratase [Pseudomonadales bacterium]